MQKNSQQNSQHIYFVTPTFHPFGGVVKIIDYAIHAKSLGYEITICCPESYKQDLPLFQTPRFRKISPDIGVNFIGPEKIKLTPNDYVFISAPPDYQHVQKQLTSEQQLSQIIHIIQNVRHANPAFFGGYAKDLLSLPFSRITVNQEVFDAINPFLNQESLTSVIPLGHDTPFFRKLRTKGLRTPMRVAYTTWKSNVGDKVSQMLASQTHMFKFNCIRDYVPWHSLRKLYHWADVFMATTDPEEGFYLPGLEAMAAGTIVVTPDVGGNRAYCRFGKNCRLVEFENPGSYASALQVLAQEDPRTIRKMRDQGYATVGNHLLAKEQENFRKFLDELKARLQN